MKTQLAGLAVLAAVALPATAEVVASAPDGFHVKHVYEVSVDAETAMAAFQDVSAWWLHSFSGDVGNMTLPSLNAGSVWLESWEGGTVEHGRVLSYTGNSITFDSALGPLLSMGVKGVFTLSVQAAENEAEANQLVFDYHVSGSALSKLDEIAPAVDGVWKEALDRLVASIAQ